MLKPIATFVLLCCAAANAALPGDWQHEQKFELSTPGLVKISLPVETLDAARAALEDLRVYDDAGNEQPYWLERPTPGVKTMQLAKSFQVTLNANHTLMTIETGLAQPIDGVTLETSAVNFIKAVRVETSTNGIAWQLLAQGLPIFRQPSGAEQMRLPLTPGIRRWLRFTVDDQRSQPIPFTNARVHGALTEAAPSEVQSVAITERNETPGQTRLTLNIGAANLDVASVTLDTEEQLFTRQVAVAVPQVAEETIREQTIGQGSIYRVALEGQPASANLSIPLNRQVPSRELVLLIQNLDSPPLTIRGARIERRPVYLAFMARRTGSFYLMTGNRRCALPLYDLASLGANLKTTAATPVNFSPLAVNPDYHAQEALPGLQLTGTSVNVSDWKFRKAIELKSSGVQQLELDLAILAHCDPHFADLRILHGSNQVPYLIQRTSISRPLPLTVSTTNDTKNPRLSRWIIHLPRPGVPITRLSCSTKTSLFQRQVSLSEELAGERGEVYRQGLGDASWVQTPDRKSRELTLSLNATPQSDTLFLETENGDNLPIQLEQFNAFYPATRVIFKAGPQDQLFCYYGNPHASPPSYDLSLMASELMTAERSTATLSDEQQLKRDSRSLGGTPNSGGIVFWAILALVVVILLAIIARLLPKTPEK
jgi:hypothetical protein